MWIACADRAHGVHLEVGARMCLGDRVLLRWHEEHARSCPADRNGLLGHPANISNGPVDRHRPGGGDFAPTGQILAGSSSCMRPSVNAKPADGPDDAFGGEVDLHRQWTDLEGSSVYGDAATALWVDTQAGQRTRFPAFRVDWNFAILNLVPLPSGNSQPRVRRRRCGTRRACKVTVRGLAGRDRRSPRGARSYPGRSPRACSGRSMYRWTP